ncbi:DUF99 family protein [Candidatus Micrarchaeota archaeon]|nr:DUF99 family protein [Candidatus Micrarchaeota archaeon]
MKAGVRVLGIDDSPFTRKDERVLVVGVVWRGGVVEGVLSTHVKRDGLDSTVKLEEMLKKSRFLRQIRIIVLHGATLAGFNIVDIRKLSEGVALPVLAVTKRKPRNRLVKKALKNLKDWERRWELVESAGQAFKFGRVYAQLAGIGREDARKFLSSFRGMPEPVRLAHTIGSGIVRGESHGKV